MIYTSVHFFTWLAISKFTDITATQLIPSPKFCNLNAQTSVCMKREGRLTCKIKIMKRPLKILRLWLDLIKTILTFITTGEKLVLTLEILRTLLRTFSAQFSLALERMKSSMASVKPICAEVNFRKR